MATDVDCRVIGAIRRVIDADLDSRRAVEALADPAIDAISMTVTEKGYCHVPATGVLDWDRQEIAADLARKTGRKSLPGFLVEILAIRMAANAPVTLVSCDNIPGNGRILKAVVSSFAEAADKQLAGWIAGQCSLSLDDGRPHRACHPTGGFAARRTARRLP